MKERKYELTNETIEVNGKTLRRIKALRYVDADCIDEVREGTLGGFIEKEENLSHEGNCWVYDGNVLGGVTIYENAKVYNAIQSIDDQNFKIHGDSTIEGSIVCDGNIEIYGKTIVPEWCHLNAFNSTLKDVYFIDSDNFIAFSDISNILLGKCSILGNEDCRSEIDGSNYKDFSLREINLTEPVKFNSPWEYGKIYGFGLEGIELEFFKTKDGTYKIAIEGRNYSIEELKDRKNNIPGVPESERINSLIDNIIRYLSE